MTKIEKIYPEQKLDTKVTPSSFIVKAEDEPEKMTWVEAMERFTNNPESEWRLPTRAELLIMYINRKDIGNFIEKGDYWSSSEKNSGIAWVQLFNDGYQLGYTKYHTRLVRLVRKEMK